MKTSIAKAAIIGHPVGHSKSPLIHNHWLQKYGIKGHYEAIDTPPEHLAQQIARLVDGGYAGFNVTLPHKEDVLKLCDGLDMLARNIGAVNLVSIENGQLMGTNSDAFGFSEGIKSTHPDFNFASSPALMIGAGGAARAVLHALLDQGVPEIRLANRTRARAEELAAQAGAEAAGRIKIIDWDARHAALEGLGLLVNTSSLGMDGQPPLDLPLDRLPGSALAADIIYTPLETRLLAGAIARGNRVVGGLPMLLHQARPAFQKWFGIMPEIDDDLLAKVAR